MHVHHVERDTVEDLCPTYLRQNKLGLQVHHTEQHQLVHLGEAMETAGHMQAIVDLTVRLFPAAFVPPIHP